MKTTKIFLMALLGIIFNAKGENLEKLINTSDQNLNIFADFSSSILHGNIEDVRTFIRIPSKLTDSELKLQIEKFLQTWKEKLVKLEGEKDVVMSLVSSSEESFSVSFKVEGSPHLNNHNNPESPVFESVTGVSSNGEAENYEGFILLLMNFRRDSDGWYFDSGSVTSSR